MAGPWLGAAVSIDIIAVPTREPSGLRRHGGSRQPACFQRVAAHRTPAVEPLIAALKDPSSRVRQTAVVLLGKFADPRSVEPLNAALQATDPLVRIGPREE